MFRLFPSTKSNFPKVKQFQYPEIGRSLVFHRKQATTSDKQNQLPNIGKSKSVVEAILEAFSEPTQKKPSGIDLDGIFGVKDRGEKTSNSGKRILSKNKISTTEEQEEEEDLEQESETTGIEEKTLDKLKYVHIYPRTIRRWVLDATTPKGFYDVEGIWTEADYFSSLEHDEEEFKRIPVKIKSNITEFVEYENLPADLRGNFRFGIKPGEISKYSPKIKELLSMQNANKGEILRFRKAKAVQNFGKCPNDTGSPGVQVAIMTHKIRSLTEHMRAFPQDTQSNRGLSQLVSKRRKMMRYLKRYDPKRYWKVLQTYNLRDMV